jgi:hypothetical protein
MKERSNSSNRSHHQQDCGQTLDPNCAAEKQPPQDNDEAADQPCDDGCTAKLRKDERHAKHEHPLQRDRDGARP